VILQRPGRARPPIVQELSLDSTTISLCLALFPWARFRQAKGGVKAHVLLSHDDYMLELRRLHRSPLQRCQNGTFLLI
jgi:hypothetical protein